MSETVDLPGPAGSSAVPARRPGAEGFALQRVSASTVAAIDPRLVSNAAAVVLDDFIVAIDAGMRPHAARLFRAALEDGFHRPVRFVCVTHHHADHTFGLAAFKDATIVGSRPLADVLEHSPDWTPEALAAWRQNDPDGGAWLDEVERVTPTLVMHERLDVTDGRRVVEFHHSGGHTSCSVWGYLPDEKVILAGDLIFSGMFPFAGDVTVDPEAWMSTLQTWLRMDVEHVIPGHGPVAGAGEIARQLEFLEALKSNTLDALADGRGPADIVVPSVYPAGDEQRFVAGTLERWHSRYGGRS